MKYFFKFLQIALIASIISGCVRAVPQLPSTPPVSPEAEVISVKYFELVNASQIEFADDLDYSLLEAAIERSINYYNNAVRDKIYQIASKQVDAAKLKETLIAFNEVIRQSLTPDELKQRIDEDFDVYRVYAPGHDKSKSHSFTLFTGYYEPLLRGSLSPSHKYRYPIYRPPQDLVIRHAANAEASIGRIEDGEFVSYYSRAEIDIKGVLRGQGLELVWVDDPMELFSLHIQGSGKIRLEDGTLLTVTYAQNNGRPFRSVTRYMLDAGQISGSEASYRNFKKLMRQKSDTELFEILSYNERYIFFRFTDGEPVGSLGEPVTADRTIATDPEHFPEGALAFIRLRKPLFDGQGNIVRRVPFSRFVLSQDKGAAIKGPGRVDLFCGFGEKAMATAGSLKEYGELYLLIKK